MSKYQPQEFEDKWYSYWLQQQFFKSVPDEREPYTIVIPPPNVTGVLHMGHMLNNTIQDVLIRRARMKGKNACWVPGTDHASIATEAKVVAMLKDKGISKKDLTRDEFLKYAWEWKEKYGGIILEQLKKLGASCDWDRTAFTMDPHMSEAVIDTFINLYKKGWIYRGVRMVNWDPQGKTAVSDEEVIRKEVNQKLYYINYKVVGSESQKDGKTESHEDEKPQVVIGDDEKQEVLAVQDELLPDLPTPVLTDSKDYLTIATTRPETIMADSAICINPNDERYTHLHGKKVLIPLINREIPVILDEYVDMEFGTGCLKVTPAHDLNDYQLGQKHNLQVIDILNNDGTLNESAQILVGIDRFAARKKIAVMLEEAGSLAKTEDYKSQIGFSERTDAVIEPKLSMQWFCKMSEMAKSALDVVVNGEVKLIPEKFINTYRHWMENVKDWNISRQLWWGQRIPAWYNEKNEWVVAKTEEEAKAEFEKAGLTYTELRQEDDVVDTWFSSWLWPISVFNGIAEPGNEEINYYYPTNDLVTAPEILFFWVARMIMAGLEWRQEVPFRNVYLTGIVRDKLGRKMSKSLGNSPDPLDLIEKYGADGVRIGMLRSSPAGNDLMFDEEHCKWGSSFGNKIWNAFLLVKGWEVDDSLECPNNIAIEWFKSRFNQALVEIEDNFGQYRLSEALMSTYKLVWDDFCAWYLEMIKPAYQKPIDRHTYNVTISYFEDILKLLHPFMPFITEELWHDKLFGERGEKDCCIVAQMPANGEVNTQLISDIDVVISIIGQVRNVRSKNQLSPKESLQLSGKINSGIDYSHYIGVIQKLANVSEFSFVDAKVNGAVAFMAYTDEFFVPLELNIDVETEKKRLEDDKVYLTGFLKSVNAKLSNEKFVANAKPEIVENEQRKKADAEAKLAVVEASLAALAN
ncbi:valine--tRNA ligase [Mucilaginibacter roseus]|uniref:Valine--tRNA ligase n=1 Tax=Mucilaginibacter roseus TaxID=1528868 RepID=A0ABS8U445_9SPHI|nr:valine--tRNA ligase [Mucilaginibacter roseus]MCD8740288.1 valine--tRNA ligase [Mucilaginibacter roseus]